MAEYRKKATDLKINVFLFTYIFYIYYTLIKLEIKAVFWRKSNKLYYFSPNLKMAMRLFYIPFYSLSITAHAADIWICLNNSRKSYLHNYLILLFFICLHFYHC